MYNLIFKILFLQPPVCVSMDRVSLLSHSQEICSGNLHRKRYCDELFPVLYTAFQWKYEKHCIIAL